MHKVQYWQLENSPKKARALIGYSLFLSSYMYTNTRESLGELEKAVETLACGSCSHSISRSPKLSLVFV